MKTKFALVIAVVLAVVLTVGAAWLVLAFNHPPLEPIVTKALFHEKNATFYTATARVSTHSQGKTLSPQVTILHSRDNEEVVYPSSSGPGMYSRTTGSLNQTYMPKTNTLMRSRVSSRITPHERARLLLANYRLKFAGTAIVAGQPAYAIRLVPKREGRPSREIWIDRRHGVVLRSVDYSYTGEERGGTEFTNIQYSKTSEPSLVRTSPVNAKVMDLCQPASVDDMMKQLGVVVTMPRYIPADYRLEGLHIYSSPCGVCKCSAQLTYTDGLSIISIFQSPNKSSCSMPCCKTRPTEAKSCEMTCCQVAQSGRIAKPDKTIVVVADLPPSEIQKIARSVR